MGVRRVDLRACAIGAIVLLAAGASYRFAMGYLRPLMTRRIELPVALSNLSSTLAGWAGEDCPLSPEVQRIAGNDDYVNRLYTNDATGEAANLYIAYSARPRTMVGHRPQVCYVGAGWIHDSSEPGQFELGDGRKVEWLIHRFHQPGAQGSDVAVLNYYVLNGVVTNQEEQFAGVGWRLPNIAGDPAWYVAQVQISSRSEATVRRLAALTAPSILDLLPDCEGRVRAAGHGTADTAQGREK